jgi:cation:H+ antiporter
MAVFCGLVVYICLTDLYNKQMDYLTLAFGLILLVVGASYFVEYAVSLARHLRLHTAIFGAVIVAIGTSLPELVVTVESAIKHAPDIIVGNILGSNIANIGLVLGVALLLGKTLPDQTKLGGKNVLLLVLSLTFIGLIQLKLLFWPAGLLLLLLAAMLVLDMVKNREQTTYSPVLNTKDHIIAWVLIVVSLLGVIVGSQLVVNSSLDIAHALGISAGVIAATMIAIGTSLPELVITITAIKKKQHSLAIGNIIGSNLFNLTLIGGVGAVLIDLNAASSLITSTFFIIFLVLGCLFASRFVKPRRLHGAVLLGLYIIFVVLNYVAL